MILFAYETKIYILFWEKTGKSPAPLPPTSPPKNGKTGFHYPETTERGEKGFGERSY